jgi:hypothetical protein
LSVRRKRPQIVFFEPGRPLAQIARAVEQDLQSLWPPHHRGAAAGEAEDEGSGGAEHFGNRVASREEGSEEDEGGDGEDEEEDVEAGGKGDSERRPLVVGVLHEGGGLNGRADVVASFRRGDCRVLLATDLAARGLDVPATSHVVQVRHGCALVRCSPLPRLAFQVCLAASAPPSSSFFFLLLSLFMSITLLLFLRLSVCFSRLAVRHAPHR